MERMMLMMVMLVMSLKMIMSDQSDTDSTRVSETSDTSDIDMGLDNKDPNLHNPIARHGYGGSSQIFPIKGKNETPPPSAQMNIPPRTTLPPKTLGEATV